jgi:heptosyltransferase-2
MTAAARELLVRLPNWVGDVCMALPALRALEERGLALRVVGRRWAGDLLAGHGWRAIAVPAGVRDAARMLRAERVSQGLLLTNSLSSAMAFRLGGVSALGYRNEGRSLLLGRAVSRPASCHEVVVFWRLASEAASWLSLPPLPAAPPESLGLRLAASHQAAARAALEAAMPDLASIESSGFVVIAPLAAGTTHGRPKAWPGFAELSHALAARGVVTVCCPGPGEEAAARAAAPAALQLGGLHLGAYAALCRQARLTIANDSGPMHLAAAVGAPVLGLFGPGDPARTRPWAPGARWLGGDGHWPEFKEVVSTVGDLLA